MKISEVEISQLYGIEHLHFKPRVITWIRGANGAGKSSVIRAICNVFAGGSDPAWLRNGQDQGFIRIKLDDGTELLKQTVKRKRAEGYRTDISITDPTGQPVPAPMTFVNRLSAALAMDPGEILRMDVTTAAGEKAMRELLMKLLPIEFGPEELEKVLTYRYSDEVAVLAITPPPGVIGLDAQKKLTEQVRELRRRTGIERDETEGTANQLSKTLGEDDGADWAGVVISKQQRLGKLREDLAGRTATINSEASSALKANQQRARAENDGIDADINAKIAELEQRRTERKANVAQCLHEWDTDTRTRATDQLNFANGQIQPEIERLTGEVAEAVEKADAHQRAAGLKQQADKFSARAVALAKKYMALSKVIDDMEQLRTSKLTDIQQQVPGLSVEQMPPTVDGVRWQDVNTARRVEIAMQLAALRSGDLLFMVLDDAEHLSPDVRTAIEQGIVAGGYQLTEAWVENACSKCRHIHPVKDLQLQPCDCGCPVYVPYPLEVQTA